MRCASRYGAAAFQNTGGSRMRPVEARAQAVGGQAAAVRALRVVQGDDHEFRKLRSLKCTEPRASRRVGQLVVTRPHSWAAMTSPDPSVGGGPTAKSGAPALSSSRPSSSHAGQGAPTHPTATTENRDD